MGSDKWSVWEDVKSTTSQTPESLISEIDAAILKLEYSRASSFLDSPPKPTATTGSLAACGPTKTTAGNARPNRYDAKIADEAYKAGCAALAACKLDEALRSLNVSLSTCPPDKTSALAKLQSLISVTSKHRNHKLQS